MKQKYSGERERLEAIDAFEQALNFYNIVSIDRGTALIGPGIVNYERSAKNDPKRAFPSIDFAIADWTMSILSPYAERLFFGENLIDPKNSFLKPSEKEKLLPFEGLFTKKQFVANLKEFTSEHSTSFELDIHKPLGKMRTTKPTT